MKKTTTRILIIGLALVLGAGAYFFTRALNSRNDGMLASGTVEATDAQLGFQAAGRIDYLGVREGDAVRQGQELARLDQSEINARLTQARAQASASEARQHDAQRDLERSRKLLAGGAIGQESFDKAQLLFRVAQSDATQAKASVQQIEAVLANMVIRASFNGVVTVRHHEPGEIVAPGIPVLTVMNPDDRWVRIYIPERNIGSVHRGQKAAISTDTWPGKQYEGEVTYIASEAEFTPKNVQTTEERVKLVYAVKVRITGDPKFELKPGMPADVRLQESAP